MTDQTIQQIKDERDKRVRLLVLQLHRWAQISIKIQTQGRLQGKDLARALLRITLNQHSIAMEILLTTANPIPRYKPGGPTPPQGMAEIQETGPELKTINPKR